MFKGDYPEIAKGFAVFTALLMIAVGCTGVWLGTEFYDSSYANALDYSWLSLICIIISVSVILVGIIGIISTCFAKNAKAAVGVVSFIQFSIVGFIVGVCLIIIGSVTLYYYSRSVEWLDNKNDCIENFNYAHRASQKAQDLLCKSYCPCDVSERIARNTGLTDYYLGSAQNALDCKPCENLKIYNTDEYNQVRLFVTGELELDWDDCVNNRLTSLDVAENYFDDEEMKNIDLLEWAEEKFNCAGFCEENNFYMFSDIDTDNSPDNVCRDELKDWVEDYFIVFGVVLLFVGLLLLLVPICTAKVWCTCFRGKVGTGEIES